MELVLALLAPLQENAPQGSLEMQARLSAQQCRRHQARRVQTQGLRSLLTRASWSYCAARKGSKMHS